MNVIAFDIGIVLSAAAAAYTLLVLVALACTRIRPRARRSARSTVPVSVLKPLRGAEPRLYENLCSFCRQDHPEFQILLGVRDPADPALAVARRVQQAFPDRDITVVADLRLYGQNHKVSNLENLLQRARHPLIVIADSDIAVGPDYLARVCAPLARPEVGIVTCLYRGRPLGGRWSELGAMYINEWFVPAVRIAQLFGSRAFGFGATLALRRETLDGIGGFHAIRDELADDYWLAQRVRDAGLATELSDCVVTTDVAEASARGLARHELRWMRTIQMLNPPGYAGMFVSFGLVAATLGAALTGWAHPGLALLGVTCAARVGLHFAAAPRGPHWGWRACRTLPLVGVRDVLGLVLWAAAYTSRQVAWAGRELNLRQ